MLKKEFQPDRQVYKVTFTLPAVAAQGAGEVRLLGDFNNWNWEGGALMESDGQEYSAVLELAAGRDYHYRYLIDGSVWENDWDADCYLPSPFDGIYNSVVQLTEAAAAPAEKPAPKAKKPAAKAKPAKKAAAGKKAAKDDLKKIEGIGPKLAQVLSENGIATFKALAEANPDDIRTLLISISSRYKMHDPTTWPEQARLADAGEWDQLKVLQDELKGGKR